MPDKFNRSSVSLDVAPGSSQSARQAEPDDPFRILLLGDFSGRKNRAIRAAVAGRRPIAVDRDNLDEVMAALRPTLRLAGTEVGFAELDDFHPDNLYARLPVFRNSPPSVSPEPASSPRVVPSGADLLASMLDEEPEPVRAAKPPTDDLAELIRRALVGQLVPKDDPRELDRTAQAHAFHSQLMRALLHHPDFQELEAIWRGLDLLVRGLETDGSLKLHIFDATLDELTADPAGLTSLLAGQAEPWGVIAANFSFGRSAKDVARLARFAKLAQEGGAPFIAESEAPTGDDAPEWQALRGTPEAEWLGLAMPRFLLRLPYGKETSSIESFPFEEMPVSLHTGYLWGNPAVCGAYLLGQSFQERGWDMRPGMHKQMSPVPQHVYQEDGATVSKPCAEILMTDSLADTLMKEGIMPLASMKDQDSVLLVRFQSIAEPLAPLAGRWSG